MNLSEANISLIFEERKQDKDKVKAINLNSLNIQSLSLSSIWTKVEYLSLKNNLIKDLSFIPYLPMLFYLDLSSNTIEDFEVINKYNTYGYLGLTSPHNFLEKKILSLRNLNVGLMDLAIRNESFKEAFIRNNPNVFFFNGHFYCYKDKQGHFDQQSNSSSLKASRLIPISQSSNEVLSKSNIYTEKYVVIDNNPSNPSLKELIALIKEYNEKLNDFNSKEKEMNESEMYQYYKYNEDMSIFKKNNRDHSMQKYERRKLLLLSHFFQKIAKYHQSNEEYFSLRSAQQPLLSEGGDKEVNFTLFKLKTIQLQLLVLSIIVLYIIGVLSKEISIEVLYFFYLKYSVIAEESSESLRKELRKLFDVKYFFFICFFYEINDHLASLCKQLKLSNRKNERNQIDFGLGRYEELRKSLKMLKLTTEISFLQLYHMRITQLIHSKEVPNHLDLIQSIMIKFFNEKSIFNETLQIIQFVNDFFISNHHYEISLIKELSFDYRIFNEIKEQMYKYLKHNQNSLSERKFFEIKLRTLSNRHCFQTTRFTNLLSIGSKTQVKTNICYYKAPPTVSKHAPPFDFYPESYTKEEHEKSMKLLNELKSFIQVEHIKQPIKLKVVKRRKLEKKKPLGKSSSCYTTKYNALYDTKKMNISSCFPKRDIKKSMSKSMANIVIPTLRELPQVRRLRSKKVAMANRTNYNQDLNKLQDKNQFLLRNTILCVNKSEPSRSLDSLIVIVPKVVDSFK